eukprot:TRINITY_DN19581_c0_g1_i3.p1 TRINITY_DN19581_c0_g1~~TRINITY_DN19581_c0_g1_i3.p1  ORF type:complete len:379 (+),score=46.47 TRINITY_DN19581_c0_g1_i3:238-1374(+)
MEKVANFGLGNAAFQGKWETAVEFIKNGCPLDSVNKAGNSALHIAAARGFAKYSAVLLGAGCSASVTDACGRTALMKAAAATFPQESSDFNTTTALLAKHTSNLTAVDNKGNSATSCAVACSKPQLAATLLSSCCSCPPAVLGGCGLSGNLPGWGSRVTVVLHPQDTPRREQSPLPEEEHIERLCACVSKCADVLNEVVGRELFRVWSDPDPPVLGEDFAYVPVSLEDFNHPKRRGNTLTTRSKGAPFRVVSALVELKLLSLEEMLSTLLHELGHALGLHAHLNDPSEMMTAHNGGWRDGAPCIGTATRRALRWLYPATAHPCVGEPVVCTSCYFEGWWLAGAKSQNNVPKQMWGSCALQFSAASKLKGRVHDWRLIG